MKIEEIDAINFKNDTHKQTKEKVVKDETITLTINGDISRSLLELFEFEKGGYILEFLRTEGDIQKFYDYFFKIKEIIKKMIKNCS